MFDSVRHQRNLCNEIRRLPNETIKQLAVRIETLLRKAQSHNKHGYEDTKKTKVLMMTLTQQLQKNAKKEHQLHHHFENST